MDTGCVCNEREFRADSQANLIKVGRKMSMSLIVIEVYSISCIIIFHVKYYMAS